MKLDELPREDGFRLRGQSVTRLETFVDAAFAFALTLLVIAGDELPGSFAELREALKRTPVFVACFVLIAMFWAAHNRWSRRFGLEDARATVLSMAFVLVVMIYVYPLRIVIASGLHLLTGGWVPADMSFSSQDMMVDLQTAFIVYGLGFSALAGLLWLLNRHALARADALQLDALERHGTRVEMTIQGILAGTGLISVLIAGWLLRYPSPQAAPVTAGLPMFVYMLLGVAIPAYVVGAERRLRRRQAEGEAG
ncbi:TMEM175 family protein [Arenimonas composti]|uniref:DUF1211 domain-containing protein n=1 Tax=Arenimonas composti TR7-09 = DSM 18010 TaxID=1121013 RepID=A0A091BWT1_9GAMM|nr:TMEM175 family protein [Arenimonas composti]KFN48805.1 hypothetical protein P873_13415 [Arenimonas composti TR7-09 = DSM 18010]